MNTEVTGDTGGYDAQGVTRQDVSGAVTGVVVRYVRARTGEFGVGQMLAAAGDSRPAQVLEDPRSWSSHDEALKLIIAAGEITGDPEIGRHIGEEILRQYDGTDVANLLRSLGSPAELLRNVTAAAAKFSTVSSLEPLEVGDAHAVVRAITRPGFIRHLQLCEFTKGLLSQVPVLFGMVPATVTESECQARGGRFCLYSVAWEAGQWSSFVDERTSLYSSAWGGQVSEARSELEIDPEIRIEMLQRQLDEMGERLEEVFLTAQALLSVDDLSELLSRITERAAHAVNAPRYLLVVRTGPEQPAHIEQSGFTDTEARALANELRQPNPDDAGGCRLIVDIASSRQLYGRLAAVYPPGMQFMEREREIFSLYANYAATALDLVTSLADSRRSNETARALLGFSRSLSKISTTDDVAQTLSDTVPLVLGCQRSTVMLWDPFDMKLTLKAVSGGMEIPPSPVEVASESGEKIVFIPEEEIDLPDETVSESTVTSISPSDTPIVNQLMSSRDILVVDRTTQDPFQLAVMERSDTSTTVFAPFFSDEEFLGVVSAEFSESPTVDPRSDRDLQERLGALADQAVTAFQNAWLLEQVGHLAWHDALTGLPNRRLLEDRVAQELERAKRVGERSSVFFVDLDRFKKVNDTLGHAAGDQLLQLVSQRLRDAVRRQDTVARLGGDEFAILLPGLADPVDVRLLAAQMIDALHEPYDLDGAEVFTSASIGISVYPQNGETYDDLLSHADEAMYRAKSVGRNNYQVYDESVLDDTGEEIPLEADLRNAVGRNELFVLYQPYIDLHTNQISGVEALVRWRHPTRGIMEPGSFIPTAEESSAIVAVDSFVINEAAHQMHRWSENGLPPLRVSVNISRRDLLDPGFFQTVSFALSSNAVPPELLELDVSGKLGDDAQDDTVLFNIAALREFGVRVTVGEHESFNDASEQLGTFPVNTLKIDRSFVQLLGPTDELHTLSRAIVDLAEKLGLECAGEYGDTPHQSRVLLQRGDTTAQGFFFSPPLLPGDVEKMLGSDGAGSIS